MTQPSQAGHFSNTYKGRIKPKTAFKNEAQTPCFQTPKKEKESQCSHSSQYTAKKKYPDSWKMYVLPGLQLSPAQEQSKVRLSIGATTKCSQISSRIQYSSRLNTTRRLGDHRTIRSHSDSGDSLSNAETQRVVRIEQDQEDRNFERQHHQAFREPTERPPYMPTQPTATRLQLENEYLRDEVEYLREKFSNCLLRKYKPGCKHLYD